MAREARILARGYASVDVEPSFPHRFVQAGERLAEDADPQEWDKGIPPDTTVGLLPDVTIAYSPGEVFPVEELEPRGLLRINVPRTENLTDLELTRGVRVGLEHFDEVVIVVHESATEADG